MTRNQIIDCARGYLGTPWFHRGRVKNVGVDCVGLLVCVARDLGHSVEDHCDYSRMDEIAVMIRELNTYCEEVSNPSFGDIVVFRDSRMRNHCGILTENGIIHANNSSVVQSVVETQIPTNWPIHRTYKFKGIQE